MVVVGALLSTAGPTPALARGFRAADTRNQDCPGVEAPRFIPAMNVFAMPLLFRSVQSMQKMLDGPIGNASLVTGAVNNSLSVAMTGIHAGAPRDAAVAKPIERMRNVE